MYQTVGHHRVMGLSALGAETCTNDGFNAERPKTVLWKAQRQGQRWSLRHRERGPVCRCGFVGERKEKRSKGNSEGRENKSRKKKVHRERGEKGRSERLL